MNSERRHLTPQEKVAALKRHLLENVPVSTICDQLGIAPTLFYRWQKELFENCHVVFENGRKAKAADDAKDTKIQQLEAKLTRKYLDIRVIEVHATTRLESCPSWSLRLSASITLKASPWAATVRCTVVLP